MARLGQLLLLFFSILICHESLALSTGIGMPKANLVKEKSKIKKQNEEKLGLIPNANVFFHRTDVLPQSTEMGKGKIGRNIKGLNLSISKTHKSDLPFFFSSSFSYSYGTSEEKVKEGDQFENVATVEKLSLNYHLLMIEESLFIEKDFGMISARPFVAVGAGFAFINEDFSTVLKDNRRVVGKSSHTRGIANLAAGLQFGFGPGVTTNFKIGRLLFLNQDSKVQDEYTGNYVMVGAGFEF